jgi:hypothetical protein
VAPARRIDIVGLRYVDATVSGPAGSRFLVDSGAKYSLLPDADWRAIGLVPRRRLTRRCSAW